MARRGPSAIVEPDELFNLCLCTGLLPRSTESVAGGIVVRNISFELYLFDLKFELNSLISLASK